MVQETKAYPRTFHGEVPWQRCVRVQNLRCRSLRFRALGSCFRGWFPPKHPLQPLKPRRRRLLLPTPRRSHITSPSRSIPIALELENLTPEGTTQNRAPLGTNAKSHAASQMIPRTAKSNINSATRTEPQKKLSIPTKENFQNRKHKSSWRCQKPVNQKVPIPA